MPIRKSRWSKVYESSEEELTAFLSGRGIAASRQTLEAFQNIPYRAQEMTYTLYLAEGSASLSADGAPHSMQPGDLASVPAATEISITAGISGCVWYAAGIVSLD